MSAHARKKQEGPEDLAGGLQARLQLESRVVIVSSAVDSDLARRVIDQLVILTQHDSSKAITLLINSPGGEVHSGFAIYDAARFLSAPLVTVVVGLAASMGSILSLVAPKGNRLATPNAKFLIHQPLLTGYQGRITELEIQAQEILRDRDRIANLYAKATGKSLEKIREDIDLDHWMNATEALEYGLVDRIITSRDEIDEHT